MVDFCVYLLYRAALALISALPLRFVFALGKWLGFGGWLILPKYRHLARRNVEIAFGAEKSTGEKERIVRRHFQQLGANLLSGMKLNSTSPKKMATRVTTEGVNQVHRELRAGRPVVLVLSHLGNWEFLAQILPQYFSYAPRLSTVYQKLGNRHLDRFVREQRARFGVELFDRSEGFQEAIRLLRGGGMIGILSDQHAGDHGHWTPFFGRLASTSPLPALLCKRTGASLIAVSIYTDGAGKWRLVFSPPFGSPNDSIPALTAQMNEVIAQEIRRAPEDWFWVHNRWKTPRPNFLLQKYKRGLFVPEAMAAGLKPFRILIRGSNWLGDSVISIPAVRAIKRGRPDAHLTILAPGKIAEVWRLVPEVDTVISLGEKSVWAAARLLKRERPFDVGIVFPNSVRVALELWLAGVPRRVGYAGHCRRWLLNQVVRKPDRTGPPRHQSEDYLQMARSLGAEAEVGQIGLPAPAPAARRIGLCPGAEYGPAKRWLPERFAEVVRAIGGEWVLFGTKKDAEVGAEIATSLGNECLNLVGKTTLKELIDELRKCRLLLTNDTGTMHLATLLGVPVVAVFGSTEPRLTGPLGSGNRVIRHQVECSPCFLRECPLDFRCMKAVRIEEVAAAILRRAAPVQDDRIERAIGR